MNPFRRKGKRHTRSRRWLVRADSDSTTVLLDDSLGEEQSQTDSLALCCVEWLEDVRGDLGVDAGTSIGKPHYEAAVVARKFDLQLATFRHRLGRVGHDVNETGSHFFGVNVENSLHLSAFLDHLDALAL